MGTANPSAANIGDRLTDNSSVATWQELISERYRNTTKTSGQLAARASRLFPGGDTRLTVFLLPYGPFVVRGEGPYLWDADGNRVLDFSSPTALIHGHAHPQVLNAIAQQLAAGTAWNARNIPQLEFAERLMGRVPSLQRIRLTNSGTEATMLMTKVARAFTQRDLVLKVDPGYHGTYDGLEFEVDATGTVAPWSGGGPANLRANVELASLNNLASVQAAIRGKEGDLAAIIVCPVVSNGPFLPATHEFLVGLREIADQTESLLLFDEVVSFRLDTGGAQKYFQVQPDLTAFGKFVGGGLPIGVFGGREDIMQITDPAGRRAITHGGTFNGNPLSAAAGCAALDLLTKPAIDSMNSLGDRLRAELSTIVAARHAPFIVHGVGSMVSMDLDPRLAASTPLSGETFIHAIRCAFYSNGVLGFPQFTVSTAMTEAHVADAVAAAAAVFDELPAV